MNAVERRPTTAEDVRAVLGNLSLISAEELNKAGVIDREAVVLALLSGGEAETFCEAGAPVCILGCTVSDRRLGTWFIATERFFNLKAATVFPSRRVLREIRERHPGIPIEACSWSKHPQARRWFELLGFKLLEANGYLRFRLV